MFYDIAVILTEDNKLDSQYFQWVTGKRQFYIYWNLSKAEQNNLDRHPPTSPPAKGSHPKW